MDCLPSLVEHGVVEGVVKLLGSPGVETQTVFNCITFLQAVSSLDGGMVELKERCVVDVLEKLKEHSEDIIKNKVTETLALLQ